jgi:hypothetical protein
MKQNIIHIFLLDAPCNLAEFHVDESQCSMTLGTHFYEHNILELIKNGKAGVLSINNVLNL